MRFSISIIKGLQPQAARAAIDAAPAHLPGPPPRESRWSDFRYQPVPHPLRCRINGDITVMGYEARPLARHIVEAHGVLGMEVRVQEGDHWDFSLCRGSTLIADFSTRVGYFNDDPAARRPWKSGSIHDFSTAWEIEPAAVAPYLIDWDSVPELGLALPTDQCPAGDWGQVFDFLRALNVQDPHADPASFRVEIPRWEPVYRRQPAWRRVVRRVSVWFKGTYPDIPGRRNDDRRTDVKVWIHKVSADRDD